MKSTHFFSKIAEQIPKFLINQQGRFIFHVCKSMFATHNPQMSKQFYSSQIQSSPMEGFVPQADILLLDVSEKDLMGIISKELGVNYLGDSVKTIEQEISGKIWGFNQRLFISLMVELNGKKKDVVFLVDTGAGMTYMAEKAIQSFYDSQAEITKPFFKLKINGIVQKVAVSPSNSHFNDINILGGMFLNSCKAKITIDYDDDVQSFKIKFP